MDTLLSHERICEQQRSNSADTGGLHDNVNMTNIVCVDYIHTTHIQIIYNVPFLKLKVPTQKECLEYV